MWRRNQSLDFTEPDGWTVKVCLLQAFMFLKSHHLYTNKKLLQSKYTFSLLLSPLWFHSWWLRFGVSERENSIFSSRHFSAHRLLSCQNPSAPFSMSSLKTSLWIYGLIWYFHLYFLVPIGARKEGRQRIPTTSRQHLSACRFHPTFLEDKKQSPGVLPVSSP